MRKYRVLAVEDDRGKELLEELEMNLFAPNGFGIERPDESQGEHLVCISCPQALHQIASHKERPYDFVLSDINLTSYHQVQIPENDPLLKDFSDKRFGTWIWRYIVENELPTQIILYTAQEEFNDLLDGLRLPKLGIDVYTYKDRPNWNELLERLKNLMIDFQIEILSCSQQGRELAGTLHNEFVQNEKDMGSLGLFLNREIELLNDRGLKEKWIAGNFFLPASLRLTQGDINGAYNDIKTVLEQSIKRTPRPQSLIFPAENEFHGMVGTSRAMQEIFYFIQKCAESSCSIFITGESGTGKELIAKALHAESRRSHKPFVAINCAALPRELIESELFGYVKGAFTGATHDKSGLFQDAHEGTLFLDEIGDMPIELQVKLLRVLEERKVRRVGSTTYDDVDVRVIAATNADISRRIAEKAFREDLYYRLVTIPIYVPPLRERREDIEVLVPHLLKRCLAENEIKAIPEIHPEVVPFLKMQQWPGNIRGLRSCLVRSIVQLAEGETLIVERIILDSANLKRDDIGITFAKTPENVFREIMSERRVPMGLKELAKEFGEPCVLYLVALAIRHGGNGKWPKEKFTKHFFNESEVNFRQWPFDRGYSKERLLSLLSK